MRSRGWEIGFRWDTGV